MAEDVVFDVIARDKASKTFGKLSGEVDRSRHSFMGLGKVAGKVFAAGAIYYGAKQVTKGLLDMGMAAVEDQAGVALLAKQLKNSAGATKEQIAQTENWITAQGKAYGVTDNDLRPAIARLATATHSVSKAQKLASLAMNVSAGTGKTLKQVTEALMKAQNGSLGGLSRLGVKTKDAAGHTITMAKAVKEMAAQFGGAAATKAQTLQGKMDRLKVAFDETKESIGYALLPILSDLADLAAKKVLPAIQRFSGWLTAHKKDISDFAHAVGDELIPPLKALASLAMNAAKFLAGLPGPVKQFAVEAAIAAMVLPRLTAGFASATAGIRANTASFAEWMFFAKTASTRAEAMQIALGKLSAAAKQAAGIGGMVLLANAFSKTAAEGNSFSSVMTGAVGGALTGFAVGGPVGAAVGALVGGGGSALFGAFHNTTAEAKKNAEAIKRLSYQKAVANIQTLRATLDQATGAYTTNTKAAIDNWLHTDEAGQKVFANLKGMHLNERTIIESLLGSSDANAKIAAKFSNQLASIDARIAASKARMTTLLKGDQFGAVSQENLEIVYNLKQSVTALEGQRATLEASKGSLGEYGIQVKQASKEQREFFRSTAPIKDILKVTRKAYLATFPKEMRGLLKVDGVPSSLAGIKKVAREAGGLTRKEWKVLLKADGIDVTKRALDDLVRVGTAKGEDVGRGFSSRVNSGLTKGAGSWVHSLFTQVTKAAAATSKTASKGGAQVGSNLQDGIMAGFAGTSARLAAAAAAAVRDAIAAARRAADAHSPSREMARLGADMGDGLVVGIQSKAAKLRTVFHGAGADLVKSLAGGMDATEPTMKRVLDKLTAYIDRESQKISNLMSKRSDIISSFGDFTSSAFTAEAPEGQKTTAYTLIKYQKAELAKAMRLKHDVAKLLKAGLSRDLIQQMAASGESGIDQIHALAQGSAAQIRHLNTLNAQTNQALTAAGTMAGNQLYGSEIKQAKRDKAVAVAMAEEFRKVLREEKGQTIVVVVDKDDGHTIRTKLLKEKSKVGHGLGFD